MYQKPRKPGKKQSRVLEFCLDEHLHEIQWKARLALRSYPQPRERSRHLHTTSIRPNFRPDDTYTPAKKISLLALILMLAIYWLLSFFGQSIVRGVSHTSGFIDMLSIMIVVLIIIRFLS
jgi:hypothetical protein